MKRIKHIALILLIVLLTDANTNAQKYFKIINSTRASWVGGMAQSGSGTDYKVIAVLLTDQKVTFTDMWVGKEYAVPRMTSFSYADGRTLTKGDTVVVELGVAHYPPQSPLAKIQVTTHKDPPIPMKGEGLLGFKIGNKTRYRSVEAFQILPEKKYQ